MHPLYAPYAMHAHGPVGSMPKNNNMANMVNSLSIDLTHLPMDNPFRIMPNASNWFRIFSRYLPYSIPRQTGSSLHRDVDQWKSALGQMVQPGAEALNFTGLAVY
jgi:hypothetical protein